MEIALNRKRKIVAFEVYFDENLHKILCSPEFFEA